MDLKRKDREDDVVVNSKIRRIDGGQERRIPIFSIASANLNDAENLQVYKDIEIPSANSYLLVLDYESTEAGILDKPKLIDHKERIEQIKSFYSEKNHHIPLENMILQTVPIFPINIEHKDLLPENSDKKDEVFAKLKDTLESNYQYQSLSNYVIRDLSDKMANKPIERLDIVLSVYANMGESIGRILYNDHQVLIHPLALEGHLLQIRNLLKADIKELNFIYDFSMPNSMAEVISGSDLRNFNINYDLPDRVRSQILVNLIENFAFASNFQQISTCKVIDANNFVIQQSGATKNSDFEQDLIRIKGNTIWGFEANQEATNRFIADLREVDLGKSLDSTVDYLDMLSNQRYQQVSLQNYVRNNFQEIQTLNWNINRRTALNNYEIGYGLEKFELSTLISKTNFIRESLLVNPNNVNLKQQEESLVSALKDYLSKDQLLGNQLLREQRKAVENIFAEKEKLISDYKLALLKKDLYSINKRFSKHRSRADQLNRDFFHQSILVSGDDVLQENLLEKSSNVKKFSEEIVRSIQRIKENELKLKFFAYVEAILYSKYSAEYLSHVPRAFQIELESLQAAFIAQQNLEDITFNAGIVLNQVRQQLKQPVEININRVVIRAINNAARKTVQDKTELIVANIKNFSDLIRDALHVNDDINNDAFNRADGLQLYIAPSSDIISTFSIFPSKELALDLFKDSQIQNILYQSLVGDLFAASIEGFYKGSKYKALEDLLVEKIEVYNEFFDLRSVQDLINKYIDELDSLKSLEHPLVKSSVFKDYIIKDLNFKNHIFSNRETLDSIFHNVIIPNSKAYLEDPESTKKPSFRKEFYHYFNMEILSKLTENREEYVQETFRNVLFNEEIFNVVIKDSAVRGYIRENIMLMGTNHKAELLDIVFKDITLLKGLLADPEILNIINNNPKLKACFKEGAASDSEANINSLHIQLISDKDFPTKLIRSELDQEMLIEKIRSSESIIEKLIVSVKIVQRTFLEGDFPSIFSDEVLRDSSPLEVDYNYNKIKDLASSNQNVNINDRISEAKAVAGYILMQDTALRTSFLANEEHISKIYNVMQAKFFDSPAIRKFVLNNADADTLLQGGSSNMLNRVKDIIKKKNVVLDYKTKVFSKPKRINIKTFVQKTFVQMANYYKDNDIESYKLVSANFAEYYKANKSAFNLVIGDLAVINNIATNPFSRKVLSKAIDKLDPQQKMNILKTSNKDAYIKIIDYRMHIKDPLFQTYKNHINKLYADQVSLLKDLSSKITSLLKEEKLKRIEYFTNRKEVAKDQVFLMSTKKTVLLNPQQVYSQLAKKLVTNDEIVNRQIISLYPQVQEYIEKLLQIRSVLIQDASGLLDLENTRRPIRMKLAAHSSTMQNLPLAVQQHNLELVQENTGAEYQVCQPSLPRSKRDVEEIELADYFLNEAELFEEDIAKSSSVEGSQDSKRKFTCKEKRSAKGGFCANGQIESRKKSRRPIISQADEVNTAIKVRSIKAYEAGQEVQKYVPEVVDRVVKNLEVNKVSKESFSNKKRAFLKTMHEFSNVMSYASYARMVHAFIRSGYNENGDFDLRQLAEFSGIMVAQAAPELLTGAILSRTLAPKNVDIFANNVKDIAKIMPIKSVRNYADILPNTIKSLASSKVISKIPAGVGSGISIGINTYFFQDKVRENSAIILDENANRYVKKAAKIELAIYTVDYAISTALDLLATLVPPTAVVGISYSMLTVPAFPLLDKYVESAKKVEKVDNQLKGLLTDEEADSIISSFFSTSKIPPQILRDGYTADLFRNIMDGLGEFANENHYSAVIQQIERLILNLAPEIELRYYKDLKHPFYHSRYETHYYNIAELRARSNNTLISHQQLPYLNMLSEVQLLGDNIHNLENKQYIGRLTRTSNLNNTLCGSPSENTELIEAHDFNINQSTEDIITTYLCGESRLSQDDCKQEAAVHINPAALGHFKFAGSPLEVSISIDHVDQIFKGKSNTIGKINGNITRTEEVNPFRTDQKSIPQGTSACYNAIGVYGDSVDPSAPIMVSGVADFKSTLKNEHTISADTNLRSIQMLRDSSGECSGKTTLLMPKEGPAKLIKNIDLCEGGTLVLSHENPDFLASKAFATGYKESRNNFKGVEKLLGDKGRNNVELVNGIRFIDLKGGQDKINLVKENIAFSAALKNHDQLVNLLAMQLEDIDKTISYKDFLEYSQEEKRGLNNIVSWIILTPQELLDRKLAIEDKKENSLISQTMADNGDNAVPTVSTDYVTNNLLSEEDIEILKGFKVIVALEGDTQPFLKNIYYVGNFNIKSGETNNKVSFKYLEEGKEAYSNAVVEHIASQSDVIFMNQRTKDVIIPLYDNVIVSGILKASGLAFKVDSRNYPKVADKFEKNVPNYYLVQEAEGFKLIPVAPRYLSAEAPVFIQSHDGDEIALTPEGHVIKLEEGNYKIVNNHDDIKENIANHILFDFNFPDLQEINYDATREALTIVADNQLGKKLRLEVINYKNPDSSLYFQLKNNVVLALNQPDFGKDISDDNDHSKADNPPKIGKYNSVKLIIPISMIQEQTEKKRAPSLIDLHTILQRKELQNSRFLEISREFAYDENKNNLIVKGSYEGLNNFVSLIGDFSPEDEANLDSANYSYSAENSPSLAGVLPNSKSEQTIVFKEPCDLQMVYGSLHTLRLGRDMIDFSQAEMQTNSVISPIYFRNNPQSIHILVGVTPQNGEDAYTFAIDIFKEDNFSGVQGLDRLFYLRNQQHTYDFNKSTVVETKDLLDELIVQENKICKSFIDRIRERDEFKVFNIAHYEGDYLFSTGGRSTFDRKTAQLITPFMMAEEIIKLDLANSQSQELNSPSYKENFKDKLTKARNLAELENLLEDFNKSLDQQAASSVSKRFIDFLKLVKNNGLEKEYDRVLRARININDYNQGSSTMIVPKIYKNEPMIMIPAYDSISLTPEEVSNNIFYIPQAINGINAYSKDENIILHIPQSGERDVAITIDPGAYGDLKFSYRTRLPEFLEQDMRDSIKIMQNFYEDKGSNNILLATFGMLPEKSFIDNKDLKKIIEAHEETLAARTLPLVGESWIKDEVGVQTLDLTQAINLDDVLEVEQALTMAREIGITQSNDIKDSLDEGITEIRYPYYGDDSTIQDLILPEDISNVEVSRDELTDDRIVSFVYQNQLRKIFFSPEEQKAQRVKRSAVNVDSHNNNTSKIDIMMSLPAGDALFINSNSTIVVNKEGEIVQVEQADKPLVIVTKNIANSSDTDGLKNNTSLKYKATGFVVSLLGFTGVFFASTHLFRRFLKNRANNIQDANDIELQQLSPPSLTGIAVTTAATLLMPAVAQAQETVENIHNVIEGDLTMIANGISNQFNTASEQASLKDELYSQLFIDPLNNAEVQKNNEIERGQRIIADHEGAIQRRDWQDMAQQYQEYQHKQQDMDIKDMAKNKLKNEFGMSDEDIENSEFKWQAVQDEDGKNIINFEIKRHEGFLADVSDSIGSKITQVQDVSNQLKNVILDTSTGLLDTGNIFKEAIVELVEDMFQEPSELILEDNNFQQLANKADAYKVHNQTPSKLSTEKIELSTKALVRREDVNNNDDREYYDPQKPRDPFIYQAQEGAYGDLFPKLEPLGVVAKSAFLHRLIGDIVQVVIQKGVLGYSKEATQSVVKEVASIATGWSLGFSVFNFPSLLARGVRVSTPALVKVFPDRYQADVKKWIDWGVEGFTLSTSDLQTVAGNFIINGVVDGIYESLKEEFTHKDEDFENEAPLKIKRVKDLIVYGKVNSSTYQPDIRPNDIVLWMEWLVQELKDPRYLIEFSTQWHETVEYFGAALLENSKNADKYEKLRQLFESFFDEQGKPASAELMADISTRIGEIVAEKTSTIILANSMKFSPAEENEEREETDQSEIFYDAEEYQAEEYQASNSEEVQEALIVLKSDQAFSKNKKSGLNLL